METNSEVLPFHWAPWQMEIFKFKSELYKNEIQKHMIIFTNP